MPVNISLAEIILILGILVALDDVITQVLKKVLSERVYGNVIATVVGLVLTVVAGLGYCSYKAIVIQWYYIPALIVAGFMVAYGAMFGFQALKDTMNWNKKQEELRAKQIINEAETEEVVHSDK